LQCSAWRRLLDRQLLGRRLRRLGRKIVGLRLVEGAWSGKVRGRSRVVALLEGRQLLEVLLKARRGSNAMLLETRLGNSSRLLNWVRPILRGLLGLIDGLLIGGPSRVVARGLALVEGIGVHG
jgi:hypothetical protein